MSMEASLKESATHVIEAVQPVSLNEIIISSELMVRPMRNANTVAETAAMESLAGLIPKGKHVVVRSKYSADIREPVETAA